jgi:hypothetical protein
MQSSIQTNDKLVSKKVLEFLHHFAFLSQIRKI